MENRARFRISAASSFGIWQSSAIASQASTSIFQPDFKLSLVRPDFAHLCPGITVDHGTKDKATGWVESVFVLRGWICEFPARIANWLRNRNRSLETGINQPLSKPGTQETPVILNAHLAAVKRSATAATISLLLSVHELTARIRIHPVKAVCAVLMIWPEFWRFLFMYWPFLSADSMPWVVVNISSIFTGRVIQSLSHFRTDRSVTLFVSNLKHSPLPVPRAGEASNR